MVVLFCLISKRLLLPSVSIHNQHIHCSGTIETWQTATQRVSSSGAGSGPSSRRRCAGRGETGAERHARRLTAPRVGCRRLEVLSSIILKSKEDYMNSEVPDYYMKSEVPNDDPDL